MVVGFNHNFRYKGEVYHVQTEDGGVKSPQVVTLLYCGGTILSSKKTSYVDLCQKENLAVLVEELMKEQHREMLRRLKDGEFDDVIDRRLPRSSANAASPPTSSTVPKKRAPVSSTTSPPPASEPVAPVDAPAISTTEASPDASAEKVKPAEPEASLDDIILSYFMGEDK